MIQKRTAFVLLQCAGCVAVLAVLLAHIPFQDVAAALAGARPAWLLLGIALALPGLLIGTLKLWIVLWSVRERRTFVECARAVMAAVAANVVLPGKGGDLLKVAFLRKNDAGFGALIGAVLLERIVDVGVLGVICACGAMYTGWTAGIWVSVCVAGCAACGIGALSLMHGSRWIPQKIRPAMVPARTLLRNRKGMLLVPLAAAGLWLNNVLVFYALLSSVGVRPGFTVVMTAAPVAILIGIIPVSISGIGTRDAALVWLLSRYAQPTPVFAAAMLYTACNYWLLGAIGTVAVGHHAVRGAAARARRERSAADRKGPGKAASI